MHRYPRRSLIVGALALLAFVLPASASALSGSPINIGTPSDVGNVGVAVDPSGTAYVAWSDTKDLPPATTDIVQYCVIQVNATTCAHSGNLTPADGVQHIDGVQVVATGTTITILADVYGNTTGAGDYMPEQEWQTTNGGASWTLVNGGLSVADGIIDADTGPLSAVILPGTNVLGYGWETADGPPTFDAFPLTSAAECSTIVCDGNPSNTDAGPYQFAELEPNTNPDQITNGGGAFASTLGSDPGVLGIFNTLFSNGPLGCSPQSFGTAFAYGSGLQSATNNYNISPGQPDSAWKVAAQQAACNVEYPAVGGGPSGFGVIQTNLINGTTVYQAFNSTTKTFAAPVVVDAQAEQQASVEQDSAGGIFSVYSANPPGGTITLSYSGDGGGSWLGPETLNTSSNGGQNDLTSSVDAGGQGGRVVDNGSMYAQQFDAADAAVANASVVSSARHEHPDVGHAHGQLQLPAVRRDADVDDHRCGGRRERGPREDEDEDEDCDARQRTLHDQQEGRSEADDPSQLGRQAPAGQGPRQAEGDGGRDDEDPGAQRLILARRPGSTREEVGAAGNSRARSTAAHEIRAALGDHVGRSVGVARGDPRHHRRIGDPHAVQAVDAELRVDDAVGRRADPAGPDRVVQVLTGGAQPLDPIFPVPGSRAGVDALAEKVGERRTGDEVVDQFQCTQHRTDLGSPAEEVVLDPRRVVRVRGPQAHRPAALRREVCRAERECRDPRFAQPVLPEEHGREVDLEVRHLETAVRAPVDHGLGERGGELAPARERPLAR